MGFEDVSLNAHLLATYGGSVESAVLALASGDALNVMHVSAEQHARGRQWPRA